MNEKKKIAIAIHISKLDFEVGRVEFNMTTHNPDLNHALLPLYVIVIDYHSNSARWKNWIAYSIVTWVIIGVPSSSRKQIFHESLRF